MKKAVLLKEKNCVGVSIAQPVGRVEYFSSFSSFLYFIFFFCSCPSICDSFFPHWKIVSPRWPHRCSPLFLILFSWPVSRTRTNIYAKYPQPSDGVTLSNAGAQSHILPLKTGGIFSLSSPIYARHILLFQHLLIWYNFREIIRSSSAFLQLPPTVCRPFYSPFYHCLFLWSGKGFVGTWSFSSVVCNIAIVVNVGMGFIEFQE